MNKKMDNKKKGIGIFIAAILAISVFAVMCVPVSAQPTNWDFETGDLTGWTTQGNVEVLQSTNFAPTIPSRGRYFVLLSTGPDNSSAPDNGDLDGDGFPDNDVTILKQNFSSGDEELCFSWSWLTDEEDEDVDVDDFFLVRLDGTIILSGSADKSAFGNFGNSTFSDIPTDDVFYSVSSPGLTNGSIFGDGRSSCQTFCTHISSGTHTIEFVVADAGDHSADSGILIDCAPPAPVPALTPIGLIALVGLLSVIAAVSIRTTVRKKRE